MTTTPTVERPFYDRVMEAVPSGEKLKLCLQCGMCSGICPYGFAMNFPPQSLIAAVRAGDLDPVFESETVWLCVSCFACANVCPAQIPLTSGLMASLKTEMLLRRKVPAELQTALENTRRYGNTLGESPRKRSAWCQSITPAIPLMAQTKEPVDVLWFVGDYASYHPRAVLARQAMAKLFQALGVCLQLPGVIAQEVG